MDISNLKARHGQLMEFMAEKGYSEDFKSEVRTGIKLVLDIGASPDIGSYEDILNRVVNDRNIAVGSSNYDEIRMI